MDLPADVAELPLDRRMHVLVCRIDLFDRRQFLLHLRELGVVENARRVQAVGVQQRPLDVVGEQLGVVRVQEVPDLGRELATRRGRTRGSWLRHSVQPQFREQFAARR